MTPEERAAYEVGLAEQRAERERQALARNQAREEARLACTREREAAAERERLEEARTRAARDQEFCRKGRGAWAETHPLVLSQLRSPSTADFVLDQDVVYRGGCMVRVRGWVDAQNGFGSMIRATYLAEMTGDPRTLRWTGFLVSMDE